MTDLTVPKRVLVVDDHPAVALALKLYFGRDRRFGVAGVATTAAHGLDMLADGNFAAVLLDLHLPDLAGPDLVSAFRDADPDVPLILHSAIGDTPEFAAARPLADGVAQKGQMSDVFAALERLTVG